MSTSLETEIASGLHTLRDRVLLDWSKRSLLDQIDALLAKAEGAEKIEAPAEREEAA
jgi:hypothetical protein